MSKKELAALSRLLQVEVVSVSPNQADFLIFSGIITNGSEEEIARAGLAVRSIEKLTQESGSKIGSGRVVGEIEVENILPGEAKDFTVITSVKASELRDYDLKVMELEVER